MQLDGRDYADIAMPEIESISEKMYRGQLLSAQDKIIREAYKKLIEKDKAKPLTLSNLWDEYVEYRGIDRDTRGGRMLLITNAVNSGADPTWSNGR